MDADQLDLLLLEAVESGTDGLLLQPGTDGFAALHKAEAAGIPYAYVGDDWPGTGRLASVMTSPESCGSLMAEAVLTHQQAPTYIVAGDFENDSFAQTACLAFEEALSGPPVAKIDTNDAQRTQEQCEELLSVHNTINTIVCFSEFGAEQAQLAAEALGISGLCIVGYGVSDAVLDGIEKGVITATVCPNYYKMGYDAACALYQYHAGNLAPAQAPFEAGAVTVTKANGNTFQAEMQSAAGLVLPETLPASVST